MSEKLEGEGTTDTEQVVGEESSSPNLVPVEEATDEELQESMTAFEQHGEDFLDKMLNPDQPKPKATEETEDTDATPEQETDSKQQTQFVSRKEYEALKNAFDAQSKQLNGLEHLRKRDAQGLADVRKQLNDHKAQLERGIQEKIDNGQAAEAMRDMKTIDKIDQGLEQLDQEEVVEKNGAVFRDIVKTFVREGELEPQDLVQSLRETGMPDAEIQQRLSRPETSFSTDGFLNLVMRAKVEKALRRIVPAFLKQREELESLKKNRNGNNILKDVSRELKRTPNATAAAGTSGSNGRLGSLSGAEIASLTDAQIDDALRNL